MSAPKLPRNAQLDETHDATTRSFVASANGHTNFPLQNLPLGIFSTVGTRPRAGVAIGDLVLDVTAALRAGLLSGAAAEAAEAASRETLNDLLAMDPSARKALRRAIFALLREGSPHQQSLHALLMRQSDCHMHMPARIGDFTDFFAGIHHATNAGSLFRPENPLLPNYKYVPVGYHGRSSSIRLSGEEIRRPTGQLLLDPQQPPTLQASRKLDFELELGIWIGKGNAIGEPIAIRDANQHIAGLCLLNDWSARDVQAWEYQPLGPFLAKNFSTTISPWIVTAEALAPYFTAQLPRPPTDPAPLPYLTDEPDQRDGALSLDLEVHLFTQAMRERNIPPHRCTRVNARELYWTFAQLVAHHTVGGCNLNPGDLLGTGTISGAHAGELGSLLEATRNGNKPISLASGETRTFLEDGDEIVFSARATRDGFAPIGFGECRARVTAAS